MALWRELLCVWEEESQLSWLRKKKRNPLPQKRTHKLGRAIHACTAAAKHSYSSPQAQLGGVGYIGNMPSAPLETPCVHFLLIHTKESLAAPDACRQFRSLERSGALCLGSHRAKSRPGVGKAEALFQAYTHRQNLVVCGCETFAHFQAGSQPASVPTAKATRTPTLPPYSPSTSRPPMFHRVLFVVISPNGLACHLAPGISHLLAPLTCF